MGTSDGEKGGPSGYLQDGLRMLRKRRDLTVRGLAEVLGRLGVPLLPSAVTKIETGGRRVDVDELVALSAALNVSPSRLLLPDSDRSFDDVVLAPGLTVAAIDAWRWADGREPLPWPHPPLGDPEGFLDGRPRWWQHVERHPLSRAVARLERASSAALGGREDDMRWARTELDRVAAELDDLERQRPGGERRG